MDWLVRTEFWATFLTLTGLEIVLGIDNIIFHSLTIANLPQHLQRRVRIAGMSLAVLMRFMLLGALIWFMSLSKALAVVLGNEISARDLVLLGGGAFLVIKSSLELCRQAVASQNKRKAATVEDTRLSIIACIAQIVVLDIVFSLDSVITAVGMVNDMRVIMLAVLVSVIVMMFFSDTVSKFLNARARLRALAFCFIALVGAVLVAEGLGVTVPKSHIYVAGAFALLLEYGTSRLACKNQKRPFVLNIPRRDFSPCLPMNVAPPDLADEPEILVRCDGCQSENKFGYLFCPECGYGLGDVHLDLGSVDYAPTICRT